MNRIDMKTIEAILFDLGGVLVELGGMATMQSWMNNAYTDDQLMEQWLASQTVREFESGNCSAAAFAAAIVRELDLPVSAAEFLDQFKTWPTRLFPGVKDLLAKLRPHYRLISLSNTNEIHWPIVMNHLGLESCFHHHFPSHLTGLFKPDQETFENVCNQLELTHSSIQFFDDSSTNIAAARALGINAVQTVGFDELEAAIHDKGLFSPTW